MSRRMWWLRAEKFDRSLWAIYPGEVEMWLVVAANAIIDNLKFLGRVHRHTGHVLHAFTHCRYVLMLVFLEPCALADSVIRYL